MKKVLIILAISICVLGTIAYGSFVYFGNKKVFALERQGNDLAQKVEAFKDRNHKFPQYLENMKLNLPDDYPLYYAITKDSGAYVIWFQIGFFKSMVYHSDTKKWQYEN